MEGVTFQGITAEAVIEQGEIPAPDTRLSADFFYPFSTNQAKLTMTVIGRLPFGLYCFCFHIDN